MRLFAAEAIRSPNSIKGVANAGGNRGGFALRLRDEQGLAGMGLVHILDRRAL